MANDRRAKQIATKAIEFLRAGGVALDDGLSESELQAVEVRLGCPLPPDLRLLLGTAVPVGPRFPTWRRLDSDELAHQLAHPLGGVLFDVQHNDRWHPDWGTRPDTIETALAVAHDALAQAPRLIPIYGHRYLPSLPCATGNPVLSVWQTDIIYYGCDLAEYADREFNRRHDPASEPAIEPPFWSYFIHNY